MSSATGCAATSSCNFARTTTGPATTTYATPRSTTPGSTRRGSLPRSAPASAPTPVALSAPLLSIRSAAATTSCPRTTKPPAGAGGFGRGPSRQREMKLLGSGGGVLGTDGHHGRRRRGEPGGEGAEPGDDRGLALDVEAEDEEHDADDDLAEGGDPDLGADADGLAHGIAPVQRVTRT